MTGPRVVERWKIGRAKVDDGALRLIAKNDRALRIEVGYGLEGVLSDAICKRIIDESGLKVYSAITLSEAAALVEQVLKG